MILPVQLVQDLVLGLVIVLVILLLDLPIKVMYVPLVVQQVNGRIVAHVQIVILSVHLARAQL